MLLCTQILVKVESVVLLVFAIIETFIETVCELVVTVIRTFVEVVRKVCRWLPWPLNKICDWVTDVIEVVTEVIEWVCHEVVIRIIRWIVVAVRYIFWLLRWICWLVDWPLRFLDILACLAGVNVKKRMALCIKILVDADGNPAVPLDRVEAIVEGARERFARCNVDICIVGIDFVSAPDDIREFTCDASGLFSSQHLFFTRNLCRSLDVSAVPITAFFVPDWPGDRGCAIPGNDYVVIGADATLATLAHELGHHADLMHRDDPANVMVGSTTDAATEFTRWQCCMIRSARYSTVFALEACDRTPVDVRLRSAREPIEAGTRPDDG